MEGQNKVQIIRHADKGVGSVFSNFFTTEMKKKLQKSLFHSKINEQNKDTELQKLFFKAFVNQLKEDGLDSDEAETVLKTIYGNERLFGLMFNKKNGEKEKTNLPLTKEGLKRSIALGDSQFEMMEKKLKESGGHQAVLVSFINRKSDRNSLTGLLAIQQIKNCLAAFNQGVESSKQIDINIHEHGLKAGEGRTIAAALADLPDATWKRYEDLRNPASEGGRNLTIHESVRLMIGELKGKKDYNSETPEEGAKRYKKFVEYMFSVLKEDYKDESAVVRVAMAIGHSGPLAEIKDEYLKYQNIQEEEYYEVNYCEQFYFDEKGHLLETKATVI